MPGRTPLLIAALWVATVAAASGLTWGVISGAGARVGQPVAVPAPAPTPGGTATPSDAPSPTWSGPAGRVTVVCAGGRVSLGSAVPSLGYRVEVKEPGPERLRLEFEPQSASVGEELKLEVTCEAGVPRFRRT